MQTFEMSTRLCFGEHALAGLKTLGAARVLIVTDGFFEKTAKRRASGGCLRRRRSSFSRAYSPIRR